MKSLPGLVLWLESEVAVDLSAASTKWADQSGKANDAVFKGATSDADLATFEAYAKSKYKLPGPP